MASFIARVELHSATYADYETLHVAMQAQGFGRTIVGGNGNTYYLPTGTYDADTTSATLQQAYDAAVVAAGRTGKAYELIVAERSGAKWIGLKQ